MGKFLFGLLLLLALAGGIFYKYFYNGSIFSKGTIDFSVQEFSEGGLIPKKFTCDDKDISPSFLIERVPGDAKSLTIIMDDPTAPSTFTHYILTDVDPQIGSIDQGVVPSSGNVLTNDYGKQEYDGPCPTLGTHKYVFRVYALDTTLNLPDSSKREDVDKAMQGHIIAKGEFSGEYTKI